MTISIRRHPTSTTEKTTEERARIAVLFRHRLLFLAAIILILLIGHNWSLNLGQFLSTSDSLVYSIEAVDHEAVDHNSEARPASSLFLGKNKHKHKHKHKHTGMDEEDTSKFAIFFNTFSTINNTQHAHNIISSQLQEINSQPLLDGAPIYYARVGYFGWDFPLSDCYGNNNTNKKTDANSNETATMNETMMMMSSSSSSPTKKTNRKGTQIAAVETGDEVVSLQPLYEYCTKHPSHRVVYMHSKGTFTQNSKNDQLRTILMRAVTSKACLNLDDVPSKSSSDGNGTENDNKNDNKNKNKRCDTCSTRLGFFPFFSYTGNMFTANCDYVSKLIPPKDFARRKQEGIDRMLNRTTLVGASHPDLYETQLDDNRGRTKYRFNKKSMIWLERKSWIGVERYASEHWIAGHPDVRPCEAFDAETNPLIKYNRQIQLDNFQEPKLVKIHETMSRENASHHVWVEQGEKNFVYHPWYGKDGRMFEYKYLYGTVPRNDSWFHNLWSQFPVPGSWQLNHT